MKGDESITFVLATRIDKKRDHTSEDRPVSTESARSFSHFFPCRSPKSCLRRYLAVITVVPEKKNVFLLDE